MNISINKDFLTEYKDDLWKGFDGKELLTIAGAGGVAATVVVSLNVFFGVSPSTAVYVAMPFTVPVLMFGFFKYQGYLSVKDLIKEMIYTLRCRHLHFETRDTEKARMTVYETREGGR